MPATPESNPSSPLDLVKPWYRDLNRYHWYVLVIAALGWLFDTMDQQLFVLARTPALTELLGSDAKPEDVTYYGGLATTIFILGWASGGLIFGLVGDRLGRARTMILTILIYSVFTGLSALSMTWWDFAAYRFLTGMGVGGEFAAGVSLVAEAMPARARPYALGLLQALSAVGNMIAAGVSYVIRPQSAFMGYSGWRMLFLIGILPALLTIVIRRGLKEPESWVQAREASRKGGTGSEAAHQLGDLRELVGNRRWLGHTLVGVMLSTAGVMTLWGVGFFTPELVRNNVLAGLDKDVQDTWASTASLLQNLGAFFGIYAFSVLAGRMGRRPAFAISFVAAWLSIVLVYGFMTTKSQILWMTPILGFCTLMPFGGYAIYFPELFPTRLRSTGTGICYNVARYLAALAPYMLGQIAAGMVSSDPERAADQLADFRWLSSLGSVDQAFRYAAIFVAGVSMLGVFVIAFAPETKDKPLPE